jgi:hypothetical protein
VLLFAYRDIHRRKAYYIISSSVFLSLLLRARKRVRMKNMFQKKGNLNALLIGSRLFSSTTEQDQNISRDHPQVSM